MVESHHVIMLVTSSSSFVDWKGYSQAIIPMNSCRNGITVWFIASEEFFLTRAVYTPVTRTSPAVGADIL